MELIVYRYSKQLQKMIMQFKQWMLMIENGDNNTPKCPKVAKHTVLTICTGLSEETEPRSCQTCEGPNSSSSQPHSCLCKKITLEELHSIIDDNPYAKRIRILQKDQQYMEKWLDDNRKDNPKELRQIYTKYVQGLREKLIVPKTFSQISNKVKYEVWDDLTCSDIEQLLTQSEKMEKKATAVDEFRNYVNRETIILRQSSRGQKSKQKLVAEFKIWSRLENIISKKDLQQLSILNQTIYQHPSSLEDLLERGNFLYRMEEYELAEADLRKSFQIDPKNQSYEPYFVLAQIMHQRDNDHDIPLAIYKKAIKLSPEPAFLCNIGLSYLEHEEYDKAEEYFLQFRKQCPHHWGAQYGMGSMCMEVGRFEDALKYFSEIIEKAIQQNLEQQDIFYEYRAKVYERLGRLNEMRADLECMDKLRKQRSRV